MHPEYAFFEGASAVGSYSCPELGETNPSALAADSFLSLGLGYDAVLIDGPACLPRLQPGSMLSTKGAGTATHWGLVLEDTSGVVEAYSGTLLGTQDASLPPTFQTVMRPGEFLYFSAWVEDPVWRHQHPTAPAEDHSGLALEGPAGGLPEHASARWGAVRCAV